MRNLNFDPFVLHSVIGGKSGIDVPALYFKSKSQVDEFLTGYGFDVSKEADLEKIWYFHRRALVLLEEKLGFGPDQIPEVLRDQKKLGDIRNLFLWASISSLDKEPRVPDVDNHNLQKWSCGLLRVMHVYVHAENDLFGSFSEEIQKQILTPFQNCIVHDGSTGNISLRGAKNESVPLLGFEVKPFKTSSSTVIKLLAKPSALALNVFDKLGFRFIAPDTFGVFRVIRFLVEENLVSFPHIIPDQTSNTLYPTSAFLKVCKDLEESPGEMCSDEKLEALLIEELNTAKKEQSIKKDNHFSGEDYQFVKFVSRKLIQIKTTSGQFSFFYPFEVQIMHRWSHEKIQTGPSEHQAYKERQRQAACERVLQETHRS